MNRAEKIEFLKNVSQGKAGIPMQGIDYSKCYTEELLWLKEMIAMHGNDGDKWPEQEREAWKMIYDDFPNRISGNLTKPLSNQ